MVKKIAFYLCPIVVIGCLSLHNSTNAHSPTPSPLPTLTVEPTPAVHGHISGVITSNKSGNPIAGAKVSLKSKELDFKEKTSTGDNGAYEFSNLSAGNYALKVKKTGYKTEKKEIVLAEGQNETIDVQLKKETSGDGY